MKYSLDNLNPLSNKIIRCAIEVHKHLGPGLLESIYETALIIELKCSGLTVENQKKLKVYYRFKNIGEFRVDLLVENAIVLELKSVEQHRALFEAQLLSYMKLGRYPLGLLINFNTHLLKHGIKRMILKEYIHLLKPLISQRLCG